MDAQALQAVASDRRRQILRLVWDQELAAGELARRFDVSWPAISQHLKVLKDAGLVTERRDGRRRLYSADPVRLGPLAGMLEEMWSNDLDRLAALAEDEERTSSQPDQGS